MTDNSRKVSVSAQFSANAVDVVANGIGVAFGETFETNQQHSEQVDLMFSSSQSDSFSPSFASSAFCSQVNKRADFAIDSFAYTNPTKKVHLSDGVAKLLQEEKTSVLHHFASSSAPASPLTAEQRVEGGSHASSTSVLVAPMAVGSALPPLQQSRKLLAQTLSKVRNNHKRQLMGDRSALSWPNSPAPFLQLEAKANGPTSSIASASPSDAFCNATRDPAASASPLSMLASTAKSNNDVPTPRRSDSFSNTGATAVINSAASSSALPSFLSASAALLPSMACFSSGESSLQTKPKATGVNFGQMPIVSPLRPPDQQQSSLALFSSDFSGPHSFECIRSDSISLRLPPLLSAPSTPSSLADSNSIDAAGIDLPFHSASQSAKPAIVAAAKRRRRSVAKAVSSASSSTDISACIADVLAFESSASSPGPQQQQPSSTSSVVAASPFNDSSVGATSSESTSRLTDIISQVIADSSFYSSSQSPSAAASAALPGIDSSAAAVKTTAVSGGAKCSSPLLSEIINAVVVDNTPTGSVAPQATSARVTDSADEAKNDATTTAAAANAPRSKPRRKSAVVPKEYEFCQFQQKSCKQRCVNGFKFCIRHILEDPSAPYKRCTHIRNKGKASNPVVCTNAISKDLDSDFCSTHLIMEGMKEKNPKRAKRKPADGLGGDAGDVSVSSTTISKNGGVHVTTVPIATTATPPAATEPSPAKSNVVVKREVSQSQAVGSLASPIRSTVTASPMLSGSLGESGSFNNLCNSSNVIGKEYNCDSVSNPAGIFAENGGSFHSDSCYNSPESRASSYNSSLNCNTPVLLQQQQLQHGQVYNASFARSNSSSMEASASGYPPGQFAQQQQVYGSMQPATSFVMVDNRSASSASGNAFLEPATSLAAINNVFANPAPSVLNDSSSVSSPFIQPGSSQLQQQQQQQHYMMQQQQQHAQQRLLAQQQHQLVLQQPMMSPQQAQQQMPMFRQSPMLQAQTQHSGNLPHPQYLSGLRSAPLGYSPTAISHSPHMTFLEPVGSSQNLQLQHSQQGAPQHFVMPHSQQTTVWQSMPLQQQPQQQQQQFAVPQNTITLGRFVSPVNVANVSGSQLGIRHAAMPSGAVYRMSNHLPHQQASMMNSIEPNISSPLPPCQAVHNAPFQHQSSNQPLQYYHQQQQPPQSQQQQLQPCSANVAGPMNSFGMQPPLPKPASMAAPAVSSVGAPVSGEVKGASIVSTTADSNISSGTADASIVSNRKVIRLKQKPRRSTMVGNYRKIVAVSRMCKMLEDLDNENSDLFPLGLEPSSSDSEFEDEVIMQPSSLSRIVEPSYSDDDEEKAAAVKPGGSHTASRMEKKKAKMLRQLHFLRRENKVMKSNWQRIRFKGGVLAAASRYFPNSVGNALIDRKRTTQKTLELIKISNGIDAQRQCMFEDSNGRCDMLRLPYSNFCLKHVVLSVDQQLFQYCSETGCSMPTFDLLNSHPKCSKHNILGDLDRTQKGRSSSHVPQNEMCLQTFHTQRRLHQERHAATVASTSSLAVKSDDKSFVNDDLNDDKDLTDEYFGADEHELVTEMMKLSPDALAGDFCNTLVKDADMGIGEYDDLEFAGKGDMMMMTKLVPCAGGSAAPSSSSAVDSSHNWADIAEFLRSEGCYNDGSSGASQAQSSMTNGFLMPQPPFSHFPDAGLLPGCSGGNNSIAPMSAQGMPDYNSGSAHAALWTAPHNAFDLSQGVVAYPPTSAAIQAGAFMPDYGYSSGSGHGKVNFKTPSTSMQSNRHL